MGAALIAKKKEHIARKCPKYQSANRSAEVNHITASEPVSDNKVLKSGSGYKTGKKITPGLNRIRRKKVASPKEIATVINKMNSSLFYINILINLTKFIKAFINNSYLCYAAFNEFIIRALKLSRIFVSYKFLKLAEKDIKERKTFFLTYANVDIDGYKKGIFEYVIKKLAFPLILRDPWLKHNNVTYKAKKTISHKIEKAWAGS
jgi:hypothetical protein